MGSCISPMRKSAKGSAFVPGTIQKIAKAGKERKATTACPATKERSKMKSNDDFGKNDLRRQNL